MDSLINAAGRALAAGDPLGALKRVALREDAPALALRGIAMAQLGDFLRARVLLRSAAKAFTAREVLARARCVVAEAEIALVLRELAQSTHALDAAQLALERAGDRANAGHALNLVLRRLLLIGRLDEVDERLGGRDLTGLPPAVMSAHHLLVAGLAIRRLQTEAASAALAEAARLAALARIPALMAEVDKAGVALAQPAARVIGPDGDSVLTLAGVEAVLASGRLVVDACRNSVRRGADMVPLSRRPVLFALLRALAEAYPGDVGRGRLVAKAFRGKEPDESHRARLRVEMGRLRQALKPLAAISATRDGFVLAPNNGADVVVLAPLVEDANGAVLALLADGEAWASSALALALDASPRTVQRALESLAVAGKVEAVGRGPARRWILSPAVGFPTRLLLPGSLMEQ